MEGRRDANTGLYHPAKGVFRVNIKWVSSYGVFHVVKRGSVRVAQ